MAGGTFSKLVGKVRPGTYINFETSEVNLVGNSERGAVIIPMVGYPYGPAGEFITIEGGSPDANYTKLGYSVYEAPLLLVKEALKNAKTVIIYIPSQGAKATKTVSTPAVTATAKYGGSRGNDLKFDIVASAVSGFDVNVYLDSDTVETFEGLATVGDLKATGSVWLDFTGTDSTALAAVAAQSLAGGADGSATAQQITTFLDSAESIPWNTMAFPLTDGSMLAAFKSKIKYLREEVGKYRKGVCSGLAADFEGIINVVNGYKLSDGTEVTAEKAVAWAAGADAGASVTESLTYKAVEDAVDIIGLKSHAQAVAAINAGQFFFSFNEKSEVAVEYDINSLTTFGDKAESWRKNRVLRVLDSLGESIMLNFPPNKYDNNSTGWDVMEGIGKSILRTYYEEGAITDVYYDRDFKVDRNASVGDKTFFNVGIKPVDSAEKLFFTITTR